MVDILMMILVGLAGVLALALGPFLWYLLLANMAIYLECGPRTCRSFGTFLSESLTLSPIEGHRELEATKDTLEDEVERQLAILRNESND